MFISQVPEGGTAEVQEGTAEDKDHSHEYQTANELFDLMAKNHNFQPDDDETLTTRDLVILYRNIDLGTQLMCNANEFKKKTPNQYVETVVYNDDPDSDSDISEIYSNENLHNVVLINKERIDLLNHPPSLENTLCQKLGDLQIQSSELTTEYDRQFLFKDPYIKEQLKTLNLITNSNKYAGTVLPASLLDYICCKRLEDNYNFYMDNIIRYVKNTIEQLKRISNGDYLTERAKEKWTEVIKTVKEDENENNTKVLETSTSIPLHVERKVTGHATTWDDIVHSEVDIRYLSKILEKKLVFEVPKLICGSYRLFSQCCEDNLIISCKREVHHPVLPDAKEEQSRVDVVFKLQRSKSGHVMSNISSIMILQKSTSAQQATCPTDLLSISYNKENIEKVEEITPKMILIEQIPITPIVLEKQNRDNIDSSIEYEKKKDSTIISSDEICFDSDIQTNDYYTVTTNISDSQNSEGESSIKPISLFSSESSCAGLKDIFSKKRNNRAEASFNAIPPDELRLTMQRLNIQSSLPEESTEDISINTNTKRRSPQRNRVKSPYENKSYILEEKKRKKLLEIRERREKKKIAMGEHCKVTKNKYGKGAIMPQTSNSVTKLSITNKSFYNSIYGQTLNINVESKQMKMKGRKDNKRDDKMSSDLSEIDDDATTTPALSKKYTNRNYYLDDTVTEMMYLQMKQKKAGNKETFSESASAASNDFNANLTMLSQLISPCSITDLNGKESMTPLQKLEKLEKMVRSLEENGCYPKNLASSQSTNVIIVPVNSPKDSSLYPEKDYLKKSSASSTSVECRKSIDKIYDLMKELRQSKGTETKLIKSKFTATTNADKISFFGDRKSSTIQGSDSGTSLKHHLTSSEPSYFSFDKTNNLDIPQTHHLNKKKAELPATVVPKVIISAKTHPLKVDREKIKYRRKSSPPNTDNPLQAISQLLHEFDNVQKTRHKVEFKPTKKIEVTTECKNGLRPRRYVRSEQYIKDNEAHADKNSKTKERKPRLGHADNLKIHMDGKQFNRPAKRQVADIIDEYKEARGEAVRGPTKLNARLNSLAQPKKTYVQAHIVECHTKYGKNNNMVSDRLQRQTAAPLAQIPERTRVGFANIKSRQRKGGAEAIPVISAKRQLSPSSTPLEKSPKHRQQFLPDVLKMASSANEQSYKQSSVVDKPTSILKKKMVEVDSYVKSHYGRILPPPTDPSELLTEGLTSRVPLIPKDIALSSLTSIPPLEESDTIGKRLHNIVDTIINSTPTVSADAKCNESNFKYSKDNTDDLSLVINLQSSKEELSANFDNHNDAIGDQPSKKNSTKESNNDRETINCINKLDTEAPLPPLNSATELEILENALHRRLSVGTFQKRLRLKNLTLTPKQSMQQVLLLQSGDVGSLVVNSTISQNYKIESNTITASKSLTETVSKVSNTKLEWNFTQIPMQITTVGYAFPVMHSVPKCVAQLNIAAYQESNKTCTCDKVNQCFKSEQSRCLRETGAQIDCKEIVAITSVIENNPLVTVENGVITELPNEIIEPHQPLKHSVRQNDEYDEKNRNLERSNIIMKENVSDKNQPHNNNKVLNRIGKQIIPEINYSDEKKKVFGPSNRIVNQINPVRDQHDVDEITPVRDQHDVDAYKVIPSNEIQVNNAEVERKAECVDYTSSLDILAGLLSEIQKITTCQTQIANNETDFQNDKQNKQLMMALLNDSANIENISQNKPHDIISITSLDKLRQLESNHSIYSYYLSNDGDEVPNKCDIDPVSEIININSKDISCGMQICADKEVNVDFPAREFVHRFTDKPSRFFPITVNHSTNVSDSLIGVLSEPSTQSMFLFPDTDLNNPNKSLVPRKEIIELSQKDEEPIILPRKDVPVVIPKNNKKVVTVVDIKWCASVNHNQITKNIEDLDIIPSVLNIKNNFLKTKNNFAKSSDFDPLTKMKRDVLVTVYSILVFTVFAALTFPDLYRA